MIDIERIVNTHADRQHRRRRAHDISRRAALACGIACGVSAASVSYQANPAARYILAIGAALMLVCAWVLDEISRN